MAKWIKTNFPGIRFREHPTRKNGIRRDQYFTIRYKIATGKKNEKGKAITTDKEEGLGWASEDWSAAKAYDRLKELKENRKTGEGPQTLAEKREISQEKTAAVTAERASKKAAVEANRKYTFKALLNAYADHLEARGKVKSAKAARSVVKVHILAVDPALAEKTANGITAHDVAALIRQAREKGKERTAGILRSTISAAYNCGRRAPFDTELPSTFIKFDIINNPTDIIPTIAVRAGNRTLTKEELKTYIAALGGDTVDMALKLALFAGGQRMAELLRASVTDWNSDTKILRLLDPKGKRRVPREHHLPLGPIAASIVSTLVKQATARETAWLFPSKAKNPVHDSIPGPRVAEIAAAMSGEPFDLRDIRRTAETMLAGLGVTRDVRAQLLSHGISGVQAQHYDRHDYLKEKHMALIKWERHLTRIASGEEESKVIRLSSTRK